MAAPIFINAQSKPAAATLTALYTVPAARRTACSTIMVAETGGATATFRLLICPLGAAGAAANAIAYDVPLAANESKAFTVGIPLNATDVVRVQASTANVTFTIFGEETDVPTA